MEKCRKCGEIYPSRTSHRCRSNDFMDDAVNLVATVALGNMLFGSDGSSSSSSNSDSSFDGFDGGSFGGGGSSGDF